MDNFKAIYKLLLALERSMDLPAFDIDALQLETMGVTEEAVQCGKGRCGLDSVRGAV